MPKETYVVTLVNSDLVVGPFETKELALEWTVKNQKILDEYGESTYQETMVSPDTTPEQLTDLIDSDHT